MRRRFRPAAYLIAALARATPGAAGAQNAADFDKAGLKAPGT